MNMVFLLYEYAYVCLIKLEVRLNDFPHCSHECGFSPVWISMWLVKFEESANALLQ